MFYFALYSQDSHSDLDWFMNKDLAAVNYAIEAFVTELKRQQRWKDVTIVLLSDFGRALTLNGSGGT